MATFEWDGNSWQVYYAWDMYPEVHKWLELHRSEIPVPEHRPNEPVVFRIKSGVESNAVLSTILYTYPVDIPGKPTDDFMKNVMTYYVQAGGHLKMIDQSDIVQKGE